MLAVERWSKNRDPLLALIAISIASLVHELSEAYQNIHKRCFYTYQFPIPSFPSWYEHYRTQRKNCQVLLEFIANDEGFSGQLASLAAPVYVGGERPNITDQSQFDSLLAGSLQALQDDLDQVPLDPVTKQEGLNYFREHQDVFAYFFLVFLPCLLIYQTPPTRLYRQARLGSVTALINLLSIDPLMLHDPRIGRQVQNIRLNGKRSDYTRIMEATTKPLQTKLSRKKLSVSLAGLLSASSTVFPQPLTEGDIRRLFYALNKDAKVGLFDEHLPDAPEALAKAIQRHRPIWRSLFQPDKNI